jgi:hypothetical protein
MNTSASEGVDSMAKNATVTDYGSEPTTEPAPITYASSGITPEIVAVIEEAATAFLGTRIRILSIRCLSKSTQDSSYWADKGRDIIHTSHNQVQRRR